MDSTTYNTRVSVPKSAEGGDQSYYDSASLNPSDGRLADDGLDLPEATQNKNKNIKTKNTKAGWFRVLRLPTLEPLTPER